MELESKGGGRIHFALGPVEKWIVSIGAAGIVAMGYWFATSVTTRLDQQSKAIGDLATQQAVTNSQFAALTSQLADVPRLTQSVAELKVRVDKHDEEIRELRRLRGAR